MKLCRSNMFWLYNILMNHTKQRNDSRSISPRMYVCVSWRGTFFQKYCSFWPYWAVETHSTMNQSGDLPLRRGGCQATEIPLRFSGFTSTATGAGNSAERDGQGLSAQPHL